jgi:hypothetical protein
MIDADTVADIGVAGIHLEGEVPRAGEDVAIEPKLEGD